MEHGTPGCIDVNADFVIGRDDAANGHGLADGNGFDVEFPNRHAESGDRVRNRFVDHGVRTNGDCDVVAEKCPPNIR